MTWPQLQRSDEFRGRWVALDHCRYDAQTAQPVEGSVVDADEDLAELCSRIRSEEGRHFAIVFCGLGTRASSPPSASRVRGDGDESYRPAPQPATSLVTH